MEVLPPPASFILVGTINKKENDIICDQEGIRFTIKSGKTNGPSSVSYQDIFAVQREDNAGLVVITIHHAGKKKVPVWTHDKAAISIKDKQVADGFAAFVNKEVQKHGSRPSSCLIFVNPDGGNKKGAKLWKDIVEPMFKLAGVNIDVVVTEHGEHAGEVIRSYDLSKIDSVLSMGGDGSFGKIVNHLMLRIATDEGKDVNNPETEWTKPNQRVGLIPSGSGMGANMVLTGTTDLVTGVLYILLGTTYKHHLGFIHDQDGQLINISSLLMIYGMFSDLGQWAEERRKYGRARFLLAVFRMLTMSMPAYDVELSYDLPNERGESSSEWVTEKRQYVNIGMCTMPQRYWRRATGPRFVLHSIHAGFPKSGLVKHLGRFQQNKPDACEFEGMDTRLTRSYKMKLSGNRTPYLSIDGEPIEFKGDSILVRFVGECLDMYGDGDALLGTKAEEVARLEEARAAKKEGSAL